MKNSRSTEFKTRSGEGGVGVDGDSKAGCGKSGFDGSRIDDGEVDGSEVGDDEIGKKAQKSSKFKNLSKSDFFILGARLAFTELRQAFVKTPILHHFDLERHIRIETNASGYAIGGVLNQLISDDSGRWHTMAFFSWKMISAKTRYETHNGELLAIVEAFKT